ncbi:hypothetical protein H6F77_12730 [Microcoleus sp. FACHB-831]|uniref:hypothetical protein n=1 Tax=Microcoleus sp. FACHB-831 TaxID=2692827 RepID=UPI001688EBD1|nr:hypothetical protein [Microcoleus sp. FACHB-831]MBD1921951.1 hypothetical protein [Microcoleus sp. FACHB-831]
MGLDFGIVSEGAIASNRLAALAIASHEKMRPALVKVRSRSQIHHQKSQNAPKGAIA